MGIDPRVEDCDCHACRPDTSYGAHDRRTIDAVVRHDLVCGAPSLRAVSAPPLDWEALRTDVDGEWVTRPLL